MKGSQVRANLHPALVGAAGLLAFALLPVRGPDLFLYNGTPSMPEGFYQRTHEALRFGSVVTLRVHSVADAYASARGASVDFRLLKRVAATDGNIVCGDGDRITIDDEVRAVRRTLDSVGRVLPSWSGCRRLNHGQVLVLGDSRDSFDGRYFGVVNSADIEGVWLPVLTWRDQTN